MEGYNKQSKDGDTQGKDDRKRRRPTPSEMRDLKAMQKLMDEAKEKN